MKKVRILAAVLITILLFGVFSVAGAADDSSDSLDFSALFDNLKEQLNDFAEDSEDDGVYNLILIGVDRRDTSWNGNSDSMILLSVNRAAKRITMMSFMRDLAAEIEGNGRRKLNAACAIGGPELLVSTLENNFGVEIDNYACADYRTMIDLIDAVGGVELDVSEAEAEYANGLITDMGNFLGEDPSPHYFEETGRVNCDGYQAVAFARIRMIGNNDYQRTERQRSILTDLLRKVKSLGAEEILNLAKTALSMVTHDMSYTKMLALAAEVPEFLSYELVESRVPFDGMYGSEGEMLVAGEPETNELIREKLYAS